MSVAWNSRSIAHSPHATTTTTTTTISTAIAGDGGKKEEEVMEEEQVDESNKKARGGVGGGSSSSTGLRLSSSSSSYSVRMWGYLPAASPQRLPLLQPTPVPPAASSSTDSALKIVCNGGCGFALAISGTR